jgi:hypothetical protein
VVSAISSSAGLKMTAIANDFRITAPVGDFIVSQTVD